MNAEDSVAALDGLLKILSQQSEISVDLSEIRGRLARYLKNNSAANNLDGWRTHDFPAPQPINARITAE
jgi:hypothetical protein